MSPEVFDNLGIAEVYLIIDAKFEAAEDRYIESMGVAVFQAWLTMLPHVPSKDMPLTPKRLFDVERLRRIKTPEQLSTLEAEKAEEERLEALYAEQQKRWEIEMQEQYEQRNSES